MTSIVRTRANRTTAAGARARHPRAFTLIELLVVISIILILTAMTLPAVGPLMASNSMMQAVNTMNALIARAQTSAEANFTTVGIRFERAFETDAEGYMLDTTGARIQQIDSNGVPTGPSNGRQPAWLPYQQARLVIQGAYDGISTVYGFRHMAGLQPVAMPKGAWLAPAYCLDGTLPLAQQTALNNDMANNNANLPNNRFSTFYIMFNREGELAQRDAADLWYWDETAATPNYVSHSNPSARGIIAYERPAFLDLPNDADTRLNYLSRQGLPVYVNRVLGTTVGGTQP